MIIKVLGNEAYRLEILDGEVIPRRWYIVSLKFYFTTLVNKLIALMKNFMITPFSQ